MLDKYLKLGIDHGTTNSGIAVMDGQRPRVIKPNGTDEIMPSAVYIDRRGRTLIGEAAIKAMMVRPPEDGNGHTGYKTRIGQDDRYEFAAAQKVKTAPELGGMVIGELLKVYREETGDDPQACVITVPAKFKQNSYEGTRSAAKLAGLKHFPLLSEPVAAAMAYDFTAADERAQWIVFDLGGGTLDVSLVIVRNGQMVVPEEGHAGDDLLGGRKFDRELFAYALGELSQRYALKSFTKNNPVYLVAWGRLMLAVEKAKIELSRREQTVIELDDVLCKDERGVAVEVSVPITRAQYVKLIAADVENAAHICQTLLTRNRLTARDIDRLILIGGPTKTPYVQSVLRDRLKVTLEDSIDPMTAVAQGAALYATKTVLPEEFRRQVVVPGGENGPVSLELQYDRTSPIASQQVVGVVQSQAAVVGGLSVEIRRADGLWTSGRLPVDEAGLFEANLVLAVNGNGKPCLSHFTTTVYDHTNRALTAVEEPEIWHPFPDPKISLANSLRVAVEGNQAEVLIEQGTELPARGGDEFETITLLRKGSCDDILKIPIVESVTHFLGEEDEHADCNVHVGTLRIHGSDKRVTADLPEGSKVELTVYVNESREIHAIATVPLLDDAEFEATFNAGAYEFDLDQIEQRFTDLQEVLAGVEQLQRDKPLPEVAEALAVLQRLSVIENITKQFARARAGESEARYFAYADMLRLAGTLNHLREKQRQVRLDRHIAELKPAADQAERQNLQEIEGELAKAQDPASLARAEESLNEIDIKIRQRPYLDLCLDMIALNGQQATSQQIEIATKADLLLGRIDQKGGVTKLTEADASELTAMHQTLLRTFPDLPRLRQEQLDKLPRGSKSLEDTSLRRAR